MDFDTLDRSAERAIAAALARGLEAGDHVVELRMSSAQAMAEAVDYLFQQQRIYHILNAADPGGRRLDTDTVYRSELTNLNVIRILPQVK